MYLFSVYCLAKLHFEDYRSGVVRPMSGDPNRDKVFLQFKEEKATEGLSESIVQLTNQVCFMVFFFFMTQIEVMIADLKKYS